MNRPNQAEPNPLRVSTETKCMQRQARLEIQMKMRSPTEGWNTLKNY